MLPAVFMSLAGVMMLVGLASLWQSLRSAFGGGPTTGGDLDAGLPERAALLAEKRTLLRTIKDIQFERDLGKLSLEDFERLDKTYRRRAKKVLALLDTDLEPHILRAENEIAEAMGEAEDRGPYRRGGAARRKNGRATSKSASKGRSKAKVKRPVGIECPACGVDNDVDALHCKGCATRIAPLVCGSCSTDNDPDAVFCKSCAARLMGGDDEE